MPRPKSLKPSYCHDRSSGRAFVTLNGKRKYLGRFGTLESRDAYDREVGLWIASGRTIAPAATAEAPSGVTVSIIAAAFWEHAQTYYRDGEGKPTSEVDNIRQALRPLRRLYGPTPAATFGPKALKGLQGEMIKLGWARTFINRQIHRVKLCFRWAVSAEMIPGTVYHALQTVSSLKAGRTDAVEAEPVRPVPEQFIASIVPYLSRHIRQMIELQLVTGMRPGELVTMRTCDIDRSGKVWMYKPAKHKTQHHGHDRTVYIGPSAQKILAPFLKLDLAAPIFSPADAEAERLAAQHERRVTPMNQGNKPGSNRKGTRRLGRRYTVNSYRRAIGRACDRADARAKGGVVIDNDERLIPRWHPHQLRHNAATRLRKQFGLEASKIILGHNTLTATQIYAEIDTEKARAIVEAVG